MVDTLGDDPVSIFLVRRGLYESFAARLDNLVCDLLREANVDVIQVQSRAKTVESFAEKIKRKGKSYKDPLVEVTDLVGLRIIAYYLEDIDRIGHLLQQEFHIHESDSVDKSAQLGLREFGYRSTHYIVSLSKSRASLIEWTQFATLKAEVQVRTSLQHAWASIDHKLNYKAVADAPVSLQRRLFRLSALFELADEEFSVLRKEQILLVAQHAAEVDAGNLSAPLDASSLEAYVDSIMLDLMRANLSDWYNQVDVSTAEDIAETRRDLLELLDRANLRTVQDLDNVVGHDDERNVRDLTALGRALTEYHIRALSVYDLLHALVLLRTDLPLNLPHAPEYLSVIRELRQRRT